MQNEEKTIVSCRLIGFALGGIDQSAVNRRVLAGKIPQPDAFMAGRRVPHWTLATIRAWNSAVADRVIEISGTKDAE